MTTLVEFLADAFLCPVGTNIYVVAFLAVLAFGAARVAPTWRTLVCVFIAASAFAYAVEYPNRVLHPPLWHEGTTTTPPAPTVSMLSSNYCDEAAPRSSQLSAATLRNSVVGPTLVLSEDPVTYVEAVGPQMAVAPCASVLDSSKVPLTGSHPSDAPLFLHHPWHSYSILLVAPYLELLAILLECTMLVLPLAVPVIYRGCERGEAPPRCFSHLQCIVQITLKLTYTALWCTLRCTLRCTRAGSICGYLACCVLACYLDGNDLIAIEAIGSLASCVLSGILAVVSAVPAHVVPASIALMPYGIISLTERVSGQKQTYQIFCRQLDGRSVAVEVCASNKIHEVKTKIERKTHMPISDQLLVWSGRLLQDDVSLSQYHIHKEATLHLVGQLRGAGPKSEGKSSGSAAEVFGSTADGAELFDEIDTNSDGELDLDELLVGLKVKGLEEGDIKGLLQALDVNKDGKISRKEWSDAWARSVTALRAAMNKGHTSVKTMASVLVMMMARPESVNFEDLRCWRGIEPECGPEGQITFRAECECVEECAGECQEYGWVRCGINSNVVPAAGCAIPKTEVRPFLGLAHIYIGVVVAPA